MLEAHEQGRVPLPAQHVEGVPLYYVLERALDELDGHRARARKQASRNSKASLKACPAEGMYTSPLLVERS
jgi:hypothetical protein